MNNRPGPRPYFLFLLPLFFVIHSWVAHLHFIQWTDCLLVSGVYCIAALALYLLFRLIMKEDIASALMATLVMAFYLFFGNLHEFLKTTGIFLHHYSVLLPVFGVMTILLTRYWTKHPPAMRLARFLNLMFLLFILADGITWVIRATARETPISAAGTLPAALPRCDSCAHPDIYLLVFDEYAGSRTLLENFHYDNAGLDSFLHAQGFHLLPESRANYPVTPFSIASMLNGAYLRGIRHPLELEPDDYTNIFEPIRTNAAVNFLLSQGYTIVNNSPFDLPGHPSHAYLPFFPTGTVLITYRNLIDCMVRDIPRAGKLGKRIGASMPSRVSLEEHVATLYQANETQLTATMHVSALPDHRPRFVYTHVMMPHEPFLFDSLLRMRSVNEIRKPAPRLKDYLGYLPYTNSRIRELITTIKKNTGGKAVILFMSDHGFRYWEGHIPDSVFFRNQNAVYFPDGNYSGFYDKISNVNQFRVVFNKLFHLDLPLLKDSTVILLDKN